MPNGVSETSWKGEFRGTASARGTIPLTERLLRCACTGAVGPMPDIGLFGYDKKTAQKKAYV